MSIDTPPKDVEAEPESDHSALDEFKRDERRPAVLLLGALIIAAIFFAIGIMVGRWHGGAGSRPGATYNNATQPPTASASMTPTPQPALAPTGSPQPSSQPQRRFALRVATFNTPEEAQPLHESLVQAGYTDIRTHMPRSSTAKSKFALLVGRFTREEARAAAKRLRATRDPRFKDVRVVADSSN